MAKYPFHVLRLGWAIYTAHTNPSFSDPMRGFGESLLSFIYIYIYPGHSWSSTAKIPNKILLICTYEYDVCIIYIDMYSTYSKMQYMYIYIYIKMLYIYIHTWNRSLLFTSRHPSKHRKTKLKTKLVPVDCARRTGVAEVYASQRILAGSVEGLGLVDVFVCLLQMPTVYAWTNPLNPYLQSTSKPATWFMNFWCFITKWQSGMFLPVWGRSFGMAEL